MKHFVNLGHQLDIDEEAEQPKLFAFFCTINERFGLWSNRQVFDSVLDFSVSYSISCIGLTKRGIKVEDIQGYLDLIPDDFSPETVEQKKKVVERKKESKERERVFLLSLENEEPSKT